MDYYLWKCQSARFVSNYPNCKLVLEKAQEIVVTRHGKPLARIIPVSQTRKKPNHAKLRALQPRQQTASSIITRADRDER